jgi:hypothetical protein
LNTLLSPAVVAVAKAALLEQQLHLGPEPVDTGHQYQGKALVAELVPSQL